MTSNAPKKALSTDDLASMMAKSKAYPAKKGFVRAASEALEESAQATAERFKQFPIESIVYTASRLIPIPLINDPLVWRNIIRKTMNPEFDLVMTPQNKQTAEEFVEKIRNNPEFRNQITAHALKFQPKAIPSQRQTVGPTAGNLTRLDEFRQRRQTLSRLRRTASVKLADLERMHGVVRHTADRDNVVFHPTAQRWNETAERVRKAREVLARRRTA